MTEEELTQLIGNGKNPFRVPDGYFDNFTSRMMEMLPEEAVVKPIARKRETIMHRLIPYAVAASIVGVVFGVATYLRHTDYTGVQESQTAQGTVGDPIDQIADYAMLDGGDFYSYLADN